jgi:hypothetical protein
MMGQWQITVALRGGGEARYSIWAVDVTDALQAIDKQADKDYRLDVLGVTRAQLVKEGDGTHLDLATLEAKGGNG